MSSLHCGTLGDSVGSARAYTIQKVIFLDIPPAVLSPIVDSFNHCDTVLTTSWMTNLQTIPGVRSRPIERKKWFSCCAVHRQNRTRFIRSFHQPKTTTNCPIINFLHVPEAKSILDFGPSTFATTLPLKYINSRIRHRNPQPNKKITLHATPISAHKSLWVRP